MGSDKGREKKRESMVPPFLGVLALLGVLAHSLNFGRR
jgi:hypothetical protein